jgi:hypothetical protein
MSGNGKKTTLNEIMGKSGDKQRKLGMADLPELLGEGMPKIRFSPVGRVRLMRSLTQRFGPGFRSIPGVTDIIKDFDDGAKFEIEIARMKTFKGKGKKRG